MFALRNQAVRQGNMPAGVAAQARALYETTRVINPIRSAIDKRASLGLGQLDNESLGDVQKILKRTGMVDSSRQLKMVKGHEVCILFGLLDTGKRIKLRGFSEEDYARIGR